MRPDDFLLVVGTDDDWGGLAIQRVNRELIDRLRRGPVLDRTDIEVAVPLARLVHDELEAFGTDGGGLMDNTDMREALLALLAVITRLGITAFEQLPFRDLATFRTFWIREGASGNQQRRRDLLNGLFDGLHDQLAHLETRALASSLIEPISPHDRTGWSRVDTEISELRRHFLSAQSPQDYRAVGNDCVAVIEALSAQSPQDYRAVGNDCVAVIEALSAQVYEPSQHLRAGEAEPPVASTKLRIERFVEDAATGSDNAALRKLARAVIEFAQHVKHSTTPTRREAGIAADAVIQLANLLRRLPESE